MNRSDQRQMTRALLLDAARSHFEQHGFHGSTVRAIAGEAQVAVGTVFVHFESKADLLHHAFHADLDGIIERTLSALPPPPIEAQLHHIVRGFLSAFAQRPRLYRTLLQESLLVTGEWGQRYRQQVEQVGMAVAGLFAAAMGTGELRPDLDVEAAVLAFVSFYYFLLIDATKHDFDRIDERMAQFDRLIAQQLEGQRP